MDYSDGQQVEPRRESAEAKSAPGLELIGPYTLIAQIAGGDFTSVHLAQKDQALGFHRLAAIKRLKPGFARQPEWTQLLLDEARLSAAVRHPNIVDIVDVGTDAGVYIVMEYIEGADLDVLIGRAGKERHPRYLVPPIVDALMGLHAVHTAHDEIGESLSMVHQAPRARHILIGIDGISRITDFSQVSARGLIPSTLRGKRLHAGYMAPEQVLVSEPVSARTDNFIAGITLWETLTGARLFHADTPALARRAVTERHIPKPSEVGLKPPRCFDDICMRALQRNPEQRYQTAFDMARELREVAMNEALYASSSELGQWVRALASRALVERRRALGADAPSQQIQLDAEEVRSSERVQVAFTSTEPKTQPVPAFPLKSVAHTPSEPPSQVAAFLGSAAPGTARKAMPTQSNTAAPLPDDASRVSRAPMLSVTTPRPVPRANGNASSAKATLMGISPRARPTASLPPPALAATRGYGTAVSRGQVPFSGPATAPSPGVTSPRRPQPSVAAYGTTSVGSMPPNATLPEGALLKDMNLGARMAPRGAPAPIITDSSQGFTPASPRAPSVPDAGQSDVGFVDAFTGQFHEHPPLHASSAAKRMLDEPERGNAGSGAYRTPSAPYRPESGQFQTADGQLPADIFARVQAARLEVGDSLRPSTTYLDDSGDWEAHGRRGVSFSSVLLLGVVLGAGFFGYRTWSERQEAARAPIAAPATSAVAPGSEPAPLEGEHVEPALPVPAVEAEPARAAVPPPARLDPPSEQAVAPSSVVPSAPAAAVPPRVPSSAELDRAAAAQDEAPQRAARPAQRAPVKRAAAPVKRAPIAREPAKRPAWRAPYEAPRGAAKASESLPDNPYE